MEERSIGFAAYVIPILGALALAVWAAVALLRPRRRRSMYVGLAEEMGWAYTPPDGKAHASEDIGGGMGAGVARRHGMAGRVDGYDVSVCDRVEAVVLGRAGVDTVAPNTSRVTQTVLEISIPGGGAPEFLLQPANWVTRQAGRLEDDAGVLFPADWEFSQSNFLTGGDRESIRSAFNERARDLLRDNEDLTIESRGDAYLLCHYGRLLNRREIIALLETALSVVGAMERQAPTGDGEEDTKQDETSGE